jgi:PAS domain S-box-containing protein
MTIVTSSRFPNKVMGSTLEHAVVVLDRNGVVVEWSSGAEQLLGQSATTAIGQPAQSLLRNDELVDRLLRGATGEHLECPLGRDDGSYLIVSWTVVPVGECVYCVGRDVTDERARETALRDSADFARLALSAVSGVGVWTYDPQSDRFFCDEEISELYGIDAEAGIAGILRSGFLANVHPDDLASLRATMAGGLMQSGDLELEYRICHPDGSTRWVLSRGHTYFDHAGAAYRRTGVGIDMTKQRLLEQQLRQSQKMEAIGQLTGGIAHDFNNMLQGVIGPLEMLRMRRGAALDSTANRYLDMAMASTRRASTLTHRLLAFSRRQPLAPQVIDVNIQVQAMGELLVRTIGKAITLALDLDKVACSIHCDPNELDNALLNLAINARDAMPDGGTLTIRNRLVDVGAGQAAQYGTQPGRFASLTVSDTGVGMAQSVADQAFNPFFTTKPIGLGTGLGLSMVYGFATQTGGFATIASSVGKGTTISIFLPISNDGLYVETLPAYQPSIHDGGGATILVVDDEPAVLAMLSEALRESDYSVIPAKNGVEARTAIESGTRVDLLVTDIGLPGMSGQQLAELARLKIRHLPILFMTGYAEVAANDEGFSGPGMAIISKPFGIDDIMVRIRQLLAGS